MTKFFNLTVLIVAGLCTILYLVASINGTQVDPFSAMVWCFLVFIQQLKDYGDERTN